MSTVSRFERFVDFFADRGTRLCGPPQTAREKHDLDLFAGIAFEASKLADTFVAYDETEFDQSRGVPGTVTLKSVKTEKTSLDGVCYFDPEAKHVLGLTAALSTTKVYPGNPCTTTVKTTAEYSVQRQSSGEMVYQSPDGLARITANGTLFLDTERALPITRSSSTSYLGG